MQKIKIWLADPSHRKYLYNIAKALVPILIISGVLLPGTETLILAFIGALLGFAAPQLASSNTDTNEPVDEEGLGD